MPGQDRKAAPRGRAGEIALLRLLVHEYRRVARRLAELPPEDAPFPPLPRLWPPDGALVGHWAEPDSRILRERPVFLLEDRNRLIAEREAITAERAAARRRWEMKERRRKRRRGHEPR